jgi:hypothetical protein
MPTGDLNYKNITVAGSGVLGSRLLFKQRTEVFMSMCTTFRTRCSVRPKSG